MESTQSSRPVALVSGASRGLGLLLAREFATRGYDVAICARTEHELRSAADLLRTAAREAGHPDVRVHHYVCDVTDREAVEQMVDQIEQELGPIEALITVAGIIQVGPAETMTLEHFDDAIGVMLWGPIHVTWSVLPRMRARGHGRIGTVTSIGGKVSPPHLLPYSTAKFGAVGFSEGLGAELAGTGVTATTIIPGLMRTGSHERAYFTGDKKAEFAWFGAAASLPLISMDAERAAEQMVDGTLDGKPTVVLTPLASIGMRVHGLMPATTIRVMGLANRLLPKATGHPDESKEVEGRTTVGDVDSGLLGALTTLGRSAAERFNQRGSTPRAGAETTDAPA